MNIIKYLNETDYNKIGLTIKKNIYNFDKMNCTVNKNDLIIIPIEIQDYTDTKKVKKIFAMIDTGSNKSSICNGLAFDMNFPVSEPIPTIINDKTKNVSHYKINIIIENDLFENIEVIESDDIIKKKSGFDMIIGLDILSQGFLKIRPINSREFSFQFSQYETTY